MRTGYLRVGRSKRGDKKIALPPFPEKWLEAEAKTRLNREKKKAAIEIMVGKKKMGRFLDHTGRTQRFCRTPRVWE